MEPNEETPTATSDATPKAKTNGRVEETPSSAADQSSAGGRHLSVPTVEQVKTTVNKAVDAAPPQVKDAVTQINTKTQKALEKAQPYQKHITVTLSGSAVLLLLIVILRRRGSASDS